jgi:serine/threonine protein kinase
LDKEHYVQGVLDHPFACKIMSTSRVDLTSLRQEIRMLQLCQHARVLLLVEHFEAHGQLYMVTGRCYGDVQSIYNTKHFKRSTPMVVLVRWVKQLLEALAHVHSMGIVHRDVKMANLFLTSSAPHSDVVLGDFGFAEYEATLAEAEPISDRHDTRIHDLRGTPLMLAPEVFLGQPQTCASDVWAAGVVMYELLSHGHPYGEFQRQRPTVDAEKERTFQRLARCFSGNPGFGQRFVALAALVTSDYTVSYRGRNFCDVPEAAAVVEQMLLHKNRATCAELLAAPLFTAWAETQLSAPGGPSKTGRARLARCFGACPKEKPTE